MNIDELKKHGVPDFVINNFKKQNIIELNPAQVKAVKQGLLDCNNMLVVTPTGSGKTAIATFAIAKVLTKNKCKAVYLVPLKALANEKYNDYKTLFMDTGFEVGISTGDIDSISEWMEKYDLLILTVEKMDSLIRHKTHWLNSVSLVVVDEIHLLNDISRGPTLEILLIILRQVLENVQILGLSATIGNPEELADWLDAKLVKDDWRPVELKKGVYFDSEIEFKKHKETQ